MPKVTNSLENLLIFLLGMKKYCNEDRLYVGRPRKAGEEEEVMFVLPYLAQLLKNG